MYTKLRSFLMLAVTTVWIACGLALPLLALAGGIAVPEPSHILLLLGSVALITLFSVLRFEFQHADNRVELSLDAAFVVLAAMLLPPPEAALVAMLGSIRVSRRYSTGVFLSQVASASLSAGAASFVVHSLVEGTASAQWVLPAALLAAVTRDALSLAGWFLVNEARKPGSGVDLVRNTPIGLIMLLDIGLPLMAVAMAGPFFSQPPLALAILLAAEGFIFLIMRLLHDEYRHRREKQYIERTFSRYVPTSLADQLMQGAGSAGDIELGGEQREVTMLFVDIRDFTTWAEQNEPRQVISELNELLGELSQAILSTGGTLDKFTGDGLMAFWGAPGEQHDQAARAYNAVIRMFKKVRECNEQRVAIGKPEFMIGIGVHTGTAMVGNIGHTERLDYTAIGDTVNLAARLEGATKRAECPLLMSEATFLALPHEAQRMCARLDSITVKGRREAVRVYTLKRFVGRSAA